jgi:hypothetical protein
MATWVSSSWSLVKNLLSKLLFLLGLATALYLLVSGASGGAGLFRFDARSDFSADSNTDSKTGARFDVPSDGRGGLQSAPLTLQQFALASAEAQGVSETPASTGPAVAGDAPAQSASVTQTGTPDGAIEGVPPEGQPGDWVPPAIPYSFEGSAVEPASSRSAERTSEAADSKDPLTGAGIGALGALAPLSANAGALSSGSYSGASAGVSTDSTLSSQDLQFLSTPFKTVFSGPSWPTSKVSGVHHPSNSQVTEFPVSTTRWTLEEGIRQDGTFSISGPNQNNLSFVLGLNLQSSGSTSWQNMTASTGAISTKVRTELRGGRPFRAFEFTLASFSLRPGEILRQVQVFIVMDVSNPSSPQISNESRISFVRTQVKASDVAWPNAVNPASDPHVVAAEIPYSIELQNAP